ncbi:MAG: SRPBCC family protein [Vicingaceae bacterium]
MKILKWILIVLVIIIGVLLIFSATQPNQIKVKESIVIASPPSQIYNEIVDFRTWGNWSVWNQMDSNMTSEYSDEMGVVGAYSEWESEIAGDGRQEIVELKPDEYIKTMLEFKGWDGKNYSEFILTEKDGKTELTWTFDGAKTPFYMNLMNTFMKPMLEKNYTESLSQLKAHIEAMPTPKEQEMPEGVEIMQVKAQPIISIKDSTTADGIGKKLADLYTELSIHASTADIEITGMPLAIYHFFSPDRVIMEAAMPTAIVEKSEGRIMAKELPSGKVVKGIFYGDYEASGTMHDKIYKFVSENGYEMKEFCWEVYANDPAEVDSAEVETHIFYPID